MDLDAVLARKPEIALVDELAHTNAPGSRHPKRWQDVEDLLDAGIDVISTVNTQHIESLGDVVLQITGVPQRETIPDAVLRAADQIEVVDLAPQALRDRLASGLVYPAERIDAALSNYFRLGNLTALRELALLWLADEVDTALKAYRAEHGIRRHVGGPRARRRRPDRRPRGRDAAPPRRAHRVALLGRRAHRRARDESRRPAGAASGRPRPPAHARRAARRHLPPGRRRGRPACARRLREGDGCHAAGHRRQPPVAARGGVHGARASARPSSASPATSTCTSSRTPRPARRVALPKLGGALSRNRLIVGFAVALVAGPLLSWLLVTFRTESSITSDVLAYQLLVIVVALIGGIWPALFAAVLSGLTLNFLFVEPRYTLTISDPRQFLALVLYVTNALLVSYVVDQAARRSRAAQRAAAESQLLATLAGSVLRGEDALQAMVTRTREAFGLTGVRLLVDGEPRVADGEPTRDDRVTNVPIGEHAVLELHGQDLAASERRLLAVIAAQIDQAIEHGALAEAAEAAGSLAETDRVRSALLAAVGHDLRRPLTVGVGRDQRAAHARRRPPRRAARGAARHRGREPRLARRARHEPARREPACRPAPSPCSSRRPTSPTSCSPRSTSSASVRATSSSTSPTTCRPCSPMRCCCSAWS